tara:strand:+ start:480 stop:722 length:243 start_codon:yes stop_codon:yes gene_type:complete
MSIFGGILPFVGFIKECYYDDADLPEGLVEEMEDDLVEEAAWAEKAGLDKVARIVSYFEVAWFGYSFRYVRDITVAYNYK